MKIFLDTANAEEIRKAFGSGCVSGVTTNPTIISREGKPFDKCIKDILSISDDITILMEVTENDAGGMVSQALKLSGYARNSVIKVPMTYEGLAAVKLLSDKGIRTCVTLVFSVNQAIAAACAGADFVAPFIGRLDDINSSGTELVARIRRTFEKQDVNTQIIAASIRSAQTVAELFEAGCDIVTMPGKILDAMISHPLTKSGLEKFEEDWKKVPVI